MKSTNVRLPNSTDGKDQGGLLNLYISMLHKNIALCTFEQLLSNSDLSISHLLLNTEGKEYSAASFRLNGSNIVFREAKITPAKAGRFVTVWKRNAEGITAPFSETDEVDFMIIAITSAEKPGYFFFPKAVLLEHGIISTAQKDGKRGMRVILLWISLPISKL